MAKKRNIRVLNALWIKGLTQKDLAGKVGVTEQTICRVINNDHAPNISTADKIAKALGCEKHDLFDSIYGKGVIQG